MSKFLVLNEAERLALFKQDPTRKSKGGFQGFMVRLQTQYRQGTKELRLTDKDLEDIPRYAFDYEGGGWEDDLRDIFERHLGPQLGRNS